MAIPNLPGWQAAILRGVGAPPTPQNLKFLNAWAQAEGGSASNNPFNTTQNGAGAISNYNGVGVKNFNSPAAGIAATIATLKNGHYAPILAALSRGNSAMADAQAEAQTPWGTGSLIEKVLGGPVTGGVPTQAAPRAGAPALAADIAGGNIPQPQMNPLSGLIMSVLANNAQIMQQQNQFRYQPIPG